MDQTARACHRRILPCAATLGCPPSQSYQRPHHNLIRVPARHSTSTNTISKRCIQPTISTRQHAVRPWIHCERVYPFATSVLHELAGRTWVPRLISRQWKRPRLRWRISTSSDATIDWTRTNCAHRRSRCNPLSSGKRHSLRDTQETSLPNSCTRLVLPLNVFVLPLPLPRAGVGICCPWRKSANSRLQ